MEIKRLGILKKKRALRKMQGSFSSTHDAFMENFAIINAIDNEFIDDGKIRITPMNNWY